MSDVERDTTAYVMAAPPADGREDRVVTYGELDDDSNRIAHLLASRGLGFGDHIAIFMPNNEWYLKVALAAHRSGIFYTAINYHFNADEVAYILDDSDARAVFVDTSLGAVLADLTEAAPAAVESRFVVGGAVDGYDELATAIADLPSEPIDEELEGSPMLYSSGTTGRPKGIQYPNPRRPFRSVPSMHSTIVTNYGITPDTVYLSPAPLYHSAPLNFNMSVLSAGATTIVMERFDPAEFLALVERYRVTLTQVVPTMFVRMLKLPEAERTRYDLSSLRSAIHAAAPCPVEIKQQMIDWWGPIIFEYYAATEGAGGTSITSEDWLTHRGSVGKSMVGILHIVDEEGNDLPPGETGVVYFEREDGSRSFEYHKDPDKTAGAFDARNWSTVGDMGYVDDDGYLYLTDRRDFMIVSGGVNIDPQEAENLLITHPKVMDAAVFGVPNAEMGEEVKAVVQPVDFTDAGAAFERELIAFCREHLAHYKCPVSIDFEQELPRQPTGKLYKRLLRDRYWTGKTSRIV
jgi:acyl-CoA synthetase (AMP-forming)/AMP-acid ligase II